MSNTVIKYIFPRQFELTNAFTCKSSHELYYVYMDRRKELDVSIVYSLEYSLNEHYYIKI